MGLISFLVHQIQTNPLASAAVVAAPVAMLTYAVRNIPLFFYNWVRRNIFTEVRIIHHTMMYSEVMVYLSEKVLFERWSKNFTFGTVWDSDTSKKKNNEPVKRFVAFGFGSHLGIYRRRLVVVNRRDQSESQGGGHSGHRETMHCRFLFGSKRLIEQFGEDVRAFSTDLRERARDITIHSNEDGSWKAVSKLKRRSFESIFLKGNVPDAIMEHLANFEIRSSWNREHGLPNHTGILLSGPPGTCKSSLIHAVASQTNRMVYSLNLSAIAKEEELSSLISCEVDWNKVILVIEDIDATKASVSERDHGSDFQTGTVSLSTLLNSLDGLMSPDGLVVIATTNHKNKLDSALLRKGRFDLQIETQLCGKDEFIRMARFFNHDPDTYPHEFFYDMSGADLRSALIEGGVELVAEQQQLMKERQHE